MIWNQAETNTTGLLKAQIIKPIVLMIALAIHQLHICQSPPYKNNDRGFPGHFKLEPFTLQVNTNVHFNLLLSLLYGQKSQDY